MRPAAALEGERVETRGHHLALHGPFDRLLPQSVGYSDGYSSRTFAALTSAKWKKCPEAYKSLIKFLDRYNKVRVLNEKNHSSSESEAIVPGISCKF